MNKLILLLLPFINTADAAVRTIYVNNKQMKQVNLVMGKSTVLHFIEKPNKVVVGNQNYFNIEFTGNDVAVQPLGYFTTNLFVYGEYHRYGFLLKVGTAAVYDDLVEVKWESAEPEIKKSRPVKPQEFSEPKKNFSQKLTIPGKLELIIMKVQYDRLRNFNLIDFEIKNLTPKEISLTPSMIKLTRANQNLNVNSIIFEKEKIANETTRGRVIARFEMKNGFSIWLEYESQKQRLVYSK